MLMGLVDVYYIDRLGITAWWYKGLLFVACMLAGVFAFGGLVMFLWYCWEKRVVAIEKVEDSKPNPQNATVKHGDLPQRKSIGSRRVIYGSRPNFTGTTITWIVFTCSISDGYCRLESFSGRSVQSNPSFQNVCRGLRIGIEAVGPRRCRRNCVRSYNSAGQRRQGMQVLEREARIGPPDLPLQQPQLRPIAPP